MTIFSGPNSVTIPEKDCNAYTERRRQRHKPYPVVIPLPAAVPPPLLVLLLGPVLGPPLPPLRPHRLQVQEATALQRVGREGAGMADAVHQVRPGGQTRRYRSPASLETLTLVFVMLCLHIPCLLIIMSLSTLWGVRSVVMFCFVFFQKFRLPVGLHNSCSIGPMDNGTCQKCFSKHHD